MHGLETEQSTQARKPKQESMDPKCRRSHQTLPYRGAHMGDEGGIHERVHQQAMQRVRNQVQSRG